MKNYYLVRAKFGHVGRNYYIVKTVAVSADSGKDAATYVRNMPRVKHHLKEAIENVEKVNFETFVENKKLEKKDPYFNVKNRQDQNRLCIGIDSLIMPMQISKKHYRSDRKKL